MGTVRLKIQNEIASGRRSGWTKLVTKVDVTKKNGYAFEGEFLNECEHDLNEGDIVIQKNPEGSVKNGWSTGVCYRVTQNGLERLHETTFDWREDFLSFRDFVAKALDQKPETNCKDCLEKDKRIEELLKEIESLKNQIDGVMC